MEKFGIFELLDALSALTQDAEKEPDPKDATFEPPYYPAADNEKPDARKIKADQALEGFYARHAAVARKATNKKND